MPPKPKKMDDKKSRAQAVRPSISTSSLVRVPDEAVPGYQDRIETYIPWTDVEVGFRHHAEKGRRDDLPDVPFREALQNKINNSILGSLLREDSTMTLEEQFELIPLGSWDNEKFGNEEAQICFRSNNCLTDGMLLMVQQAVKKGGRMALKEKLNNITTLRLIDSKLTELDGKLGVFRRLTLLNVCGNYVRSPLAALLPPTLRALELHANRLVSLSSLSGLHQGLVYLGLGRNFLRDDCGLDALRFSHIRVLDLSDNDIYELEPVVVTLSELVCLTSLALAGNPCSVCAAYAAYVLERLPRLRWLDGCEPLERDRPEPKPADVPPEPPHPDDLRSAYFVFTCYRIMSVLQPPKAEKGCTITFHVEMELPLLDGVRRQFLMSRRPESLVELFPDPEEQSLTLSTMPTPPQTSRTKQSKKGLSNTTAAGFKQSKLAVAGSKQSAADQSQEEDIYAKLAAKSSREILHYTTFESNRVQWNKIINFQEPTLRIFCPELCALRDTFRTAVTVRLIFTVTSSPKGSGATARKSPGSPKAAGSGELRCVVCSVVCNLRAPSWTQRMQDFHWDDTMPTDHAMHWEGGDLSVLQYNQPTAKSAKATKQSADAEAANPLRMQQPTNLTCHFGFGVETLIGAMRP